jgi:hypothetical protein
VSVTIIKVETYWSTEVGNNVSLRRPPPPPWVPSSKFVGKRRRCHHPHYGSIADNAVMLCLQADACVARGDAARESLVEATTCDIVVVSKRVPEDGKIPSSA